MCISSHDMCEMREPLTQPPCKNTEINVDLAKNIEIVSLNDRLFRSFFNTAVFITSHYRWRTLRLNRVLAACSADGARNILCTFPQTKNIFNVQKQIFQQESRRASQVINKFSHSISRANFSAPCLEEHLYRSKSFTRLYIGHLLNVCEKLSYAMRLLSKSTNKI